MLYYTPDRKATKRYFLQLRAEEYPRSLGVIRDGKRHVRRNPEYHIHYKSNAYGFNAQLINLLPDDMEIIVTEIKRNKLKTTVGAIKEAKLYLSFIKDGFESQMFLPLDKFDVIQKQKSKRVRADADELF